MPGGRSPVLLCKGKTEWTVESGAIEFRRCEGCCHGGQASFVFKRSFAQPETFGKQRRELPSWPRNPMTPVASSSALARLSNPGGPSPPYFHRGNASANLRTPSSTFFIDVAYDKRTNPGA